MTPTGAPWTAERIRALGPVTDVPTAAAIFGLSRSVAYDLARTGDLPVPVLRFGGRYRIPVAAILTALHMPLEPPPPATT
jgi:predicted DNA-binding transcriptional regulator AlpA